MTSPAVYRRTGQFEVTIRATFGRTTVDVADEVGTTIQSHVFDFIINVDELPSTPAAGDVVLVDGRKHEVLAVAGEEWRWSDQYRTAYRVHTKDVGEVQ